MTMVDELCDVCKVNKPIGVASTAIPLSVAYCRECAQRNAQPLCVFLMWEDEIGPPKNHAFPDIPTFVDGKYVSYRKWYHQRKNPNDKSPQLESDVHQPQSTAAVPTEPGTSKRSSD